MFIPAWIFILVAIVGFIFLTPYRQGLIDFFGTVWDIFCGALEKLWDFVRGAGPITGAGAVPILGWIGAGLLCVALIGILFFAFMYFIIGAGIMTIGIATGHWQAALLFLLALMIWGMFSMTPTISIFRPLNFVSRWIVRPLAAALFVYLVVVTGWWIFGNTAPEYQESVARFGGNRVGEFKNGLNKSSMKSEPEMGIFAKIAEDSQVYNKSSDGIPVFFVQRGTTVKVSDLNGKKADVDSEGMTKVMLPNRHGDFQQGNEGWIPTRKLELGFIPTSNVDEQKNGKLITVVAKSNNEFAVSPKGGLTLPPGQYCQNPAGKTTFQLMGESRPSELGDGKNFTVPQGKEVVGVRTEHPLVSIYEGSCG